MVDWTRKGYVDFDDFAGTARSLFDELDVKGTGVLTAQQAQGAAMRPARPRTAEAKSSRNTGISGGGRGGGGRGGARAAMTRGQMTLSSLDSG